MSPLAALPAFLRAYRPRCAPGRANSMIDMRDVRDRHRDSSWHRAGDTVLDLGWSREQFSRALREVVG